MKLIRGGTLFIGLLAVAGATHAGVTSTWTVTNDYDFRGNSQSAKDPALQASVDYAHDSGFYVGAWGSNIDFAAGAPYDDPGYEIDLYAGFTKTLESGFGYDFGVVQYTYPEESDFSYTEIYAGFSKDWFKAKLWYSPEFGGNAGSDLALANTLGASDDAAAWYAEANATIPLPSNFSVTAHLGYSTGDYWDDAFGDDQIDYAVGVGYAAGKVNLGLKYVDTDSDTVVTSDAFNNEGRVILTVATTFPWGE